MKKSYLLLFVVSTINIYAQRTGNIFQYPDGTFASAIRTSDFQQAQQYKNLWCWAACISMVLKYQGIDASQRDIVTKVFGTDVNSPGNQYDIIKGANGWSKNGKTIKAYDERSRQPEDLIDGFAYKYPFIVGISNPGSSIGHAYVLTAIYYSQRQGEQPRPTKVALRDPWPSSPPRREMDWAEFLNRVTSITHVTY